MSDLAISVSPKDQLIQQAKQAYADCQQSIQTSAQAYQTYQNAGRSALERAIACGEVMNELQAIILEEGLTWTKFVADELPRFPLRTIQDYQRMARKKAFITHAKDLTEARALLRSVNDQYTYADVVALYSQLPEVEVKQRSDRRQVAIEMPGLSKIFTGPDDAYAFFEEAKRRLERRQHQGAGNPETKLPNVVAFQSCSVCIHFLGTGDRTFRCGDDPDSPEYSIAEARTLAQSCSAFQRNPDNDNGYAEMRYKQVCDENAATTERIAAEDRAITASGSIRVSDSGDRVTIYPQTNQAISQPIREGNDRVTDIREKMTSSLTCEHYTPQDILECVYELGDIDLDPCSNSDDSDIANVKALRYFTVEDDGLSQSWCNRNGSPASVFINPPYSMLKRDEHGNIVINPKTNKPVMVSVMGQWSDKMLSEWDQGHLAWAIALVKGDTSTQWHRKFRDFLRCEYAGRVEFRGNDAPATFCTHLIYLGKDNRKFSRVFSRLGDIYKRVELHLSA